MSETLVVNEIYLSLQGEKHLGGIALRFLSGLPACNLRCSYCDTAYAFTQGAKQTVAQAREEVARLAQSFPRSPPGAGRLPFAAGRTDRGRTVCLPGFRPAPDGSSPAMMGSRSSSKPAAPMTSPPWTLACAASWI